MEANDNARRLEFVFIDCRVPDIPHLLEGLHVGVPPCVLDRRSDGFQQIADHLFAHSLTNLKLARTPFSAQAPASIPGRADIREFDRVDHR